MANDTKSHAVRSGLDGVIVLDTEVSQLDGERGALIVRGHSLETLVENHGFETASHLLITGRWPDPEQGEAWRAELCRARCRAAARLHAPPSAPAMNFLLQELAALEDDGGGTELSRSSEVIATTAVACAAWIRARQGASPLVPHAGRRHAEDTLRLATGVTDPARTRAFERYLVTVLEHGMNASTFATRVVASTNSDLSSSVSAGVGALKGPLHGGAPGPVLDMLDAIGDATRARAWLENELTEGRRIMGFGHRVYRVRDPRAQLLERTLLELGANAERLELARAVEREAELLLGRAHPGRELHANVEFFTALLLEALGAPRDAFSAVFACGRVAGWCAHYFEQQREGRLLRPRARYIGPAPAPPPAPAAP